MPHWLYCKLTYLIDIALRLWHPAWLSSALWQVSGGVTAAKGFRATGTYAGLRAAGTKPDLSLVLADSDATVAGKRVLRLPPSGSHLLLLAPGEDLGVL